MATEKPIYVQTGDKSGFMARRDVEFGDALCNYVYKSDRVR